MCRRISRHSKTLSRGIPPFSFRRLPLEDRREKMLPLYFTSLINCGSKTAMRLTRKLQAKSISIGQHRSRYSPFWLGIPGFDSHGRASYFDLPRYLSRNRTDLSQESFA